MGTLTPIVPTGTARLRTTVTAHHTTKDIDYFVDVLEKGAAKLSVL